MTKTLTDAERIARDKKREAQEQKYAENWKKREARKRVFFTLLQAKCEKAGIKVTEAEVDAEMKKK